MFPRDLSRHGRAPTARHQNLYSDLIRRNLACQANLAFDETQPLSNRRDKARVNQTSHNTELRVCSALWRQRVCAQNSHLQLAAVARRQCALALQYQLVRAKLASHLLRANTVFALRFWPQVFWANAQSAGRSHRLREFRASIV